jgi:hypothetical protein
MTEKPKQRFSELVQEIVLLLSEGREAEAVPAICEAFYLTLETEPEDGDWAGKRFNLSYLLSVHHTRRQGELDDD